MIDRLETQIQPDCGSLAQRQNYIFLLQKATAIYKLTGLPNNLNSLFENYTVPANVPVKTPAFIFLDLPQHLNKDFDFNTAHFAAKRWQSGSANVLFNEDFTLVFGRVSPARGHYGYGVLLRTNQGHQVFTPFKHTIDREAYRYSPRVLLSDLQELVVLALYRSPTKLAKYKSGNDKIASFLDSNWIVNQELKRFAIACSLCGEDRYVTRIVNGKPGISCDVCFAKWKTTQAAQVKLSFESN